MHMHKVLAWLHIRYEGQHSETVKYIRTFLTDYINSGCTKNNNKQSYNPDLDQSDWDSSFWRLMWTEAHYLHLHGFTHCTADTTGSDVKLDTEHHQRHVSNKTKPCILKHSVEACFVHNHTISNVQSFILHSTMWLLLEIQNKAQPHRSFLSSTWAGILQAQWENKINK